MVRGDIPSVARALIIEEGDLLIGARGASTDVCFASPLVFGAFVSLDLYLVRPNRTIVNSQYLAAFLELATTQALLASGKQGTGLARLGKDALETMQIPLPAMRKQKLIAELRTALEGEAKILRKLADLSSIFGQEILMRAIEASGAQHNLIRSSQ